MPRAGVKAEALPYLRIMFFFSGGMMVLFYVEQCFRSAGDAKTPMILGYRDDGSQRHFQRHFYQRIGTDSLIRVKGSRHRNLSRVGIGGLYSFWKLWNGDWVISIRNKSGYAPDWDVIRKLVQIRFTRRNSRELR